MSRPSPLLLPREPLHLNACDPRFRVDEDDVEAAADGAVALTAAGGDEADVVTHLEEFRLGDGFHAHPDKMGEYVMVFLQDSDDLGIAAPPLPRLAIVVAVLTRDTTELLVLPSIGQRVAALQTVSGIVIQFVHHGQSFFARENGRSARLIQG